MKHFYLLCLLCSQILFAQQGKKSISGTFINQDTNETIPFVTIYLKNPKQTQTDIADINGAFLFKNLSQNNYSLVVDAIGYKPYEQTINFTNKTYIDLGNINLSEDIQALDAVQLRAETTSVEQKIDRVVIKVGKDLTSVGTDAASVLDNVQSVTVDQQTGELSLRGNSNVIVLVDGKPTNIPTDQLIKQLPANAIKNIELITNPSAKYSPEGNSGIINIELVKNSLKGFNSSSNGSLTYGRNWRGNIRTNLNYKINKVNVYGNYSFRGGDSDIIGTFIRPNDNRQNSYGLNKRKNHFVKVGSDIDLNEKTSISLFTVQTFEHLDYSNSTVITDLETNALTNDNLFQLNRKPSSQNYDASFHKKFNDPKHTLDFGISYNTRKAPENSNWIDYLQDNNNQEYNYTETIGSESNSWIVNLDYANPINDNTFIEIGLDLRQWHNSNFNNSNQLVYNSEENLVTKGLTDFDFNRNIYSGYVNFRQQINKLGLQAGLRTELYNVDANFYTDVDTQEDDVTDKKTSLYPSFYATYELNKKDQLQFSYSRRVDRPSIKQLNPIRTWGTPLLISQGNPELKQQFTNSFEFRYNRKISGGNLSLTGFYRRINDFISRTLSEDTLVEDRILMSYGNFDSSNNYGAELATYLKFSSWWNFTGSSDLYYQNQQGIVNGELTSVDNVLFNFRLNNKFTMGQKLSLQMSQLYRGKDENVQRVRKAMFMTNLGASYKVLKDNGTVTLSASDIFDTFNAKFNIDNPIEQNGEFDWESQRITLGFTYNFGSQFQEKEKPNRPSHDDSNGSGDVF